MTLPDELRAYIITANKTIDECASEIKNFEEEKKSLLTRVLELDEAARLCEKAFQGHYIAAPIRIEIGGLEANIRCLDQQIDEQNQITDKVIDERSTKISDYLSENDRHYADLFDHCQNLEKRLLDAKEACRNFIENLDAQIKRVVDAQHVRFIHGQSLIALVDGKEVKNSLGRTNTEIYFFNENFDYDLFTTERGVISDVCVPYGGASVNYLHEAKRQIILRKEMVLKFYIEIDKKLTMVFDPVEACVDTAIEEAITLGSPYR